MGSRITGSQFGCVWVSWGCVYGSKAASLSQTARRYTPSRQCPSYTGSGEFGMTELGLRRGAQDENLIAVPGKEYPIQRQA
jgi:hypothetical protein